MQTGTFHVFPECRHQQVADFGASACWWSTELGHMEQVDEYLELLYGPKGLGLNVLRINVGGGVRDDRSDSFPTSTPEVPTPPWMKTVILISSVTPAHGGSPKKPPHWAPSRILRSS